MKLMGILLMGLTGLTLIIGFLTLWAGETEVLSPRSDVLESRTEGAGRPAVHSGEEFKAPGEIPPGPFYVP